MAVTALSGRYARRHGLASSFLPRPDGPEPTPSSTRPTASARTTPSWVGPTAVGAVLSLGLAAADDLPAIAAILASGLAAAGVAALAQRRIGGFTGDTLGAAGVVAETAGLLVAAAVLR
jgi:cobalamin synthase